MKFIDFFAGVGGFRRGMELAGHECVGFCEFDDFATASYTSMHLVTDEQRKYLETLKENKRKKEILKEEYRNGEWYAKDIREVRGEDLPRADCWCFGSPCQGFSVAGKQLGLSDERSNLYFQIIRILKEQREEDRPQFLFMENVKNLLSINRGWDFARVLSEMAALGYDVEWQLLNSKDYGVPQNRERVFIIGNLRGRGGREVFPITGTTSENSIEQIGKYEIGKKENPNAYRVYNSEGISPTLGTMQGGGREPHIQIWGYTSDRKINQRNRILKTESLSPTITATDYKEPLKVAIPVLTPNRANKRQNGRRFKEDGDPMFTLTAQDRHGVMIDVYDFYNKKFISNESIGTLTANTGTSTTHCGTFGVAIKVKENTKKEYTESYKEDSTSFSVSESKTKCGCDMWYEKYQCYIRVRKLTPKECFRLQGWTDDYFQKAQFVNSDSQLYKQAGNGVTVNVIKAIAERLKQ